MPEEGISRPELVQSGDSFAAMVFELGKQARVAVDTESNSLHAYRERVCLLQFSSTQRDYVLDPLAVTDLAPLGSLLQDARIEKVFHAAEYDILCLRRDYGFGFANIFDTMQAGRILGRRLAGLDRLLEDKLGLVVSKRFQKADWGARPLSPELLQYAAQDTHYLIALRNLLEVELREKGLLELAHEDFRMACSHQQPAHARSGEPPAWLKLRGRRDLKPQELTILKELLEWREAMAQQLDRPPFKVMSDDRLIDVARSQPSDLAGLQTAGLTERQVQQWGVELLDAVRLGLNQPIVSWVRPAVPAADYLKRLEELKEWRKKAAEGMQVESDVVLPRGLLLALADGGAKELNAVMGPSPWRLRRFGDEIAAILERTSSN